MWNTKHDSDSQFRFQVNKMCNIPLIASILNICFLARSGRALSFSGDYLLEKRPLSLRVRRHDNLILYASSIHKTNEQESIPVLTRNICFENGINCEVMTAIPKKESMRPPLVFIHGSFHAAWCWGEHYLPHFASLGYYSTAISLRGTNGTYAGEGITKIKISNHVDDIEEVLKYLSNEVSTKPPIIITHSFGGVALMKYLEKLDSEISKNLSGIIMLCSVPPSGNGKMTLRFLKRSLSDSWKIIQGFVFRKCIKDNYNCRTLFFDDDLSEEDLLRYQSYFKRDVIATIDLRDLSSNLPSKRTTSEGVALFTKYDIPPVLVVGALNDFIVDKVGVEETGTYFNQQPVYIQSSHDVMLGKSWRNGADLISKWIDQNNV